MKSWLNTFIRLSLCLLLTAPYGYGQDAETINFSIEAMAADAALAKFAQQAEQQVFYPAQRVANIQANSLQGHYKVEQAIAILLADTGLKPVFSKNNILTIVLSKKAKPEEAIVKFKKKQLPGVIAFIVSLLGAGEGYSQQQNTDDIDTQQDSKAVIEEIQVIGTHIEGVNITDTLPVTVLDQADLDMVGAVEAEELLRSLAQAGSAEYNANNSAGGVNQVRGDVASVNLRGIGTGNTLMLINGRRMVMHPGFHNENGVPVVSPNMNAIPATSIKRLEVLRDGAAALYGADAVAGVLNNVLRNDFTGVTLQTRYGAASSNSREDISGNIRGGFDFNQGATKLAIFADYSRRNPVESSEVEQAASGNVMYLLEGTAWEGSTQWDNRSSSTAWGGFQALGEGYVYRNGKRITDSTGGFHIQPNTNSGCLVQLADGLCLDNGKAISSKTADRGGDRNLYYDYQANRQLVSKRDRYNLFTTLSHELDNGHELYGEASYYWAQTDRLMEHPTVLSTARLMIPKENYYNPFGATTLADGSPNPNRISGIDVPDEGVDLLMYRYRVVDAGRRRGIVTNKSYRFLAGIRGDWNDWSYDSAILQSQSISDDVTKNGVSTTLLQKALAKNTPDAYNPFNGTGGSITTDLTPNPESVIESIQADVFKYGKTSLSLVDFKMSNPAVFSLPAGDVGLALGLEARRESFVDDRGPRLDGSMPFVDQVNGKVSQSDALGNSPTNDSKGSRRVYSAFGEMVLPLVHEGMEIPLVNSLTVQLAARYEAFSDTENVIKPRFAASWALVPGLSLRGLYSEGFRAPNLIQLNDTGLSRINTVVDYHRCQALVAKGTYSSESKCKGTSIERFSSGNAKLKPEHSKNYSLGFVIDPEQLPGLTLTLDYWQVEQDNLVGLFGNSNHSQLDRFLRNEGTSNSAVVRADISQEDIDLYQGSGINPVGEIVRIVDPYANLNLRTVQGEDLALHYQFDTDNLGRFKFSFNASHLNKFEQEAGAEGQKLIDNGIAVTGLGDLIQQNGRPEWRYSTRLHWKRDNWGFGLYGRYVGSFYDTSAKVSADGETEYWKVKPFFKLNATLDYKIPQGALKGTKLRLGVKNLANREAPLADERYGFAHKLHSITGRYWYLDIKKKFN